MLLVLVISSGETHNFASRWVVKRSVPNYTPQSNQWFSHLMVYRLVFSAFDLFSDKYSKVFLVLVYLTFGLFSDKYSQMLDVSYLIFNPSFDKQNICFN